MLTVVVVLGCRPDGNRPTSEMRKRVRHGVEVAMQEGSSLLLFSGGRTASIESEASIMHRVYETDFSEVSIPSILENRSLDTIGNAYFSVSILSHVDFERLIVVRSPSHVRRSAYLFSFMLGSEVATSTFGKVPEEMTAVEERRLKMAKTLFEDVRSGDMDEIWKRMRSFHPLYSEI